MVPPGIFVCCVEIAFEISIRVKPYCSQQRRIDVDGDFLVLLALHLGFKHAREFSPCGP